jgi:hypothetical protein
MKINVHPLERVARISLGCILVPLAFVGRPICGSSWA